MTIPSDPVRLDLTENEIAIIDTACQELVLRIYHLRNKLRQEFPHQWEPPELQIAEERCRSLRSLIYRKLDPLGFTAPNEVAAADLPLLKLALLEKGEELALSREETARLTHRDEPAEALLAQITTVDGLLERDPFRGVTELPNLALSAYFNMETIHRLLGEDAVPPARVFDSKFHILTSQELFLTDLRFYRQQCTLRHRPVTVAYIDIDNFGQFNRSLPGKETQVDRDILPRFMSALEAAVFGRGFAYREGGDEYLVLLPNTDDDDAKVFFSALRLSLASLRYPITMPGPTVSIGVCTASATERLTPLQIQLLANKAKAFAKTGGRNRVAGYRQNHRHAEDALIVLDPPEGT